MPDAIVNASEAAGTTTCPNEYLTSNKFLAPVLRHHTFPRNLSLIKVTVNYFKEDACYLAMRRDKLMQRVNWGKRVSFK